MKFRHLNHEKLVILAVWVGLIGGLSTLGWEIPVTSVIDPTAPKCDKGTHWDDLDDSCKIKILEDNAVGSEATSISDLIVSVLWGSSYDAGRTSGSGGHPGIDIVSVAGTPIFAIYDGTVTYAGAKGTYGNVVTIKHTLPDATIVYSNYSHLEHIFVEKGEMVHSGKQVGTMGKTGFTMGKYGNHLDFQITTENSPAHPYGYVDCQYGYMNAVQTGSCRDKMEAYTIDPIVFFEEYADIDLSAFVPESALAHQEHAVADVDLPENEVTVIEEKSTKIEDTNTKAVLSTDTEQPITIAPDNKISTLLALLRKDRANQTQSIFLGLQNQYSTLTVPGENTTSVAGSVKADTSIVHNTTQKIERELGATILNQGKLNKITFSIQDQFGVPYNGSLKEKIILEYDKEIISIAPSRFGRVVGGSKTLFITPKETGETTVTIKYGETVLGTETITVL